MKVPPLDLEVQYEVIGSDLERRVGEVFRSHRYILGPFVTELEERIADLCGVKHGIGVASGSDGLLLSLMALDIGSGDQVVTTPFTFFSTVSAITRLGATPVFVDIDPRTFNLDPHRLSELDPGKIKAILPVHLYGQLAEVEEISPWADQRGIEVVEDAAQAIGASRRGKPAGSWGTCAAFSFYPTKNLGGAGDGGMIVTNNDDIARRLQKLRDHGAEQRYYHDEVGINSRLDALQAAVLLAKLPHLDEWNRKRREIAARYREALQDLPVEPPYEDPNGTHVYHQFVIRSDRRDELKAFLDKKGIYTAIFYPVPLHLQKCFAFSGYKQGDFPAAEKAAQEVLALPIFPELGEERFGMVVEAVKEFFKE